jgi:hypothetical protein
MIPVTECICRNPFFVVVVCSLTECSWEHEQLDSVGFVCYGSVFCKQLSVLHFEVEVDL